MSYIEQNGYFIFDGIKSSDYGVWISGGGTFNAPKRRYKDYTVPGRNGTLTIDEGVFEEIEVIYPAFIARDFPANIEAFRNELMARSGYVRMTDSYHPDEYYLAKYMDGLEADVLPAGVGGQFNLKFRRDPRRFLVSGETPSKYPADATSANNLIAYPYHDTTKSIDRMNFTDNGDRTITVRGNSTGTEKFALVSSGDGIRLPAGTYTAAGAKSDCYIEIRVSSGSGYYRKAMDLGSGTPAIFTITDEEAMYPYEAYIVAQNGAMPYNVIISPRLWANALKNPTLFKSRPQIKITPTLNLIKRPYYNGFSTKNGITYSDAGNGAVKASGTATDNSQFVFVRDEKLPSSGTYKLNGAPAGTNLVLYLKSESTGNYIEKARDAGSGTTFSLSAEEAQKYIQIALNIDYPFTIDAIFTPLLELVSTDAKTVVIGSQTITVNSVGDYVIVDSEIQSCYRGTNNLNSQVIFSPNDFPTLAPGANNIAYSDGIGSVEITPNWYRV